MPLQPSMRRLLIDAFTLHFPLIGKQRWLALSIISGRVLYAVVQLVAYSILAITWLVVILCWLTITLLGFVWLVLLDVAKLSVRFAYGLIDDD